MDGAVTLALLGGTDIAITGSPCAGSPHVTNWRTSPTRGSPSRAGQNVCRQLLKEVGKQSVKN